MKRYFAKIDLFAPSLGDTEAIILYSFWLCFEQKIFKKKKKKKKTCLHLLQKSLVGDNQTIIFLGRTSLLHLAYQLNMKPG